MVMDKVSIQQLNPGMILSQDVKDPNGRLLAAAGQEISGKLIRVFKIWGVGDLRVQAADSSAQAEPEIPADIRRKAEDITSYRFQFNDLNDPFVYELFRIAVDKKARQLLENPDLDVFADLQPPAGVSENDAGP